MKKLILFFLLTISLTAMAQSKPVSSQVKPTVSILGDSYSTFEGYIPSTNEVWYSPYVKKRTDVTKVSETWWWQVITEGGFKLGINESWSGATISYQGYGGDDYYNRSFITRALNLGNPDIIFICGATNDSWANVEVGEYQYSDWTRQGLYKFRPAMAKLLDVVCNHYIGAKIYFILNSDLRPEINESVETICKYYNVPIIKLHDIDKINGHPSVKGMKAFAEQVLKAISI